MCLCGTVQKNLIESLKEKFNVGTYDILVLITDIKKESLNQDLDSISGM